LRGNRFFKEPYLTRRFRRVLLLAIVLFTALEIVSYALLARSNALHIGSPTDAARAVLGTFGSALLAVPVFAFFVSLGYRAATAIGKRRSKPPK
jgi:hypothetical protein